MSGLNRDNMISLANRFYDNKEYMIAIKYLKKAFFIDIPCDRDEEDLVLNCYLDKITPLVDTIESPVTDVDEIWSDTLEEEFESNIAFKLNQILDDGIDFYENILLRLQFSNTVAPGSIEHLNILKGYFHQYKAEYVASSSSESRNQYVKAKECYSKVLEIPAYWSHWYWDRLDVAYKLVCILARELGALQDAIQIAEDFCKQANVDIPLLALNVQPGCWNVLQQLETVLNNWRNIQV